MQAVAQQQQMQHAQQQQQGRRAAAARVATAPTRARPLRPAAASTRAALALAAAALGAASLTAAATPSAAHAAAEAAAAAFPPYPEPANALSLPTWAIHVSSVSEWVIAMSLAWRYAQVSGNPRWKGLTWGMIPALGSAACACTWHFFYNAPELDGLVALQAFLTVVGNFTLWWAAYRIYKGGVEAEGAEASGK